MIQTNVVEIICFAIIDKNWSNLANPMCFLYSQVGLVYSSKPIRYVNFAHPFLLCAFSILRFVFDIFVRIYSFCQ